MSTVGDIPPKFDINQAYQRAFAYARPPFPVLVAESKTFGVSPVGTIEAIVGSFQMKSKTNADFTIPTKLDGWQMPNEPTISLRAGKRIEMTDINRLDPITGLLERRNVLEEVSLGNYEIRLRGIIINEDDFDAYPKDDVIRIREICEKPGSVKIENAILGHFNINRVAIKFFDFQEVVGYVGAQAYELVLIQDDAYSLLIDKANEPEK
jgi:hypothetical protein